MVENLEHHSPGYCTLAMNLTDPLYGSFEITEPVLLDVLNAAAVQRLRTVYSMASPV